jgi:enoyl-[acyl-carrier-protein] reductase (NADH)
LPHITAGGRCKTVNLAFIACLQPAPGIGIRGIGKVAILMFTLVFAQARGASNIQVNAIASSVI